MVRTPARRPPAQTGTAHDAYRACSAPQNVSQEPRNRAEHQARSAGYCRRIGNYVGRARLSAYGGVVPVVGQVKVTPTTRGLPGGDLAQQLLDWLAQGALWGCLAALLIGGLVWGLSARAGNSMQAGTGRTFAIGGAVGALIAGLAPTIVNTFFNEAQ
jgi:hypothetical protein